MQSPLAVVAMLAAYTVLAGIESEPCVDCSWHSLHAVMAAVWPASRRTAGARALKQAGWVPTPPAADGAPAAGASGSRGHAAAPRDGTLAAALAAGLAAHAPGIALPDLHAATLVNMASRFAASGQLGAAQMQQLLVLVHDVPAGAGASS